MSLIKLGPDFKDYIWGGTRLRDDYNKKCSLERIAESWELACRKDGCCTVQSGEYKGLTLGEYIERKGRGVLGTDCVGKEDFPLLVKLIDAQRELSVQVHPDDGYAFEHEGEQGKTEMWYVIDCEPDSEIIYGFKDKITKAQFAQSVKDGTLLERLNRIRVGKGDVFFVPPGTVHSIGKGILIAEIQQNSNTTYRVYDYGRVGADGRPRELHIDKASQVISTQPPARTECFDTVRGNGFEYRLLARCGYFSAVKLDVHTSAEIYNDKRSFAHLLMLEGSAELGEEKLKANKGDSFFIDAASGTVRICGECSLILTRCGCEERTDRLVKE